MDQNYNHSLRTDNTILRATPGHKHSPPTRECYLASGRAGACASAWRGGDDSVQL